MFDHVIEALSILFFVWIFVHGVSAWWMLRRIEMLSLDENCPDGWHLNFVGRWPWFPSKAGWYGPCGEYVAIRPHWPFPLLCRVDRIPRGSGYTRRNYRRVQSWTLPTSAVAQVNRYLWDGTEHDVSA